MKDVLEFYEEYTESVEIAFYNDQLIKVYFQVDPKTRCDLELYCKRLIFLDESSDFSNIYENLEVKHLNQINPFSLFSSC